RDRPGDRPARLSAGGRRRLRSPEHSALGDELSERRGADGRARAPGAALRDGPLPGALRLPLAPAPPAACPRKYLRLLPDPLGSGALRRRVRAPQPGDRSGSHAAAVDERPLDRRRVRHSGLSPSRAALDGRERSSGLMRPILFHIGDIAVPSFWTMAFLAFLLGFFAIRAEVARRRLDPRFAYDITLWAYVGGWGGARLFIIPTRWKYFGEDPIGFLTASSGWVWYGGLIGGAAAVLIWARSERLPALVVADIVAPALAVGLAVGRIGCQLAGDGDYGVPSDLPWAMSYPHGV